MKRRLVTAAKRDIAEIASYHDLQQAGLGDRFLTTLEDGLLEIEARPAMFSFVETLPTELGYRRLLLAPFRYVVIYRVADDEIIVYAVVHTSRMPNHWLGREGN